MEDYDEILKTFDYYKEEQGFDRRIKDSLRHLMTRTKNVRRMNEKYMSNGYFKAREIFTKMKSEGAKPKTAFFNAELPGGFLFAALDIFHNIDWVASSYKPKDPKRGQRGITFLEDRYQSLKNNPDRWLIDKKEINGEYVYVDGDMTGPTGVVLAVNQVKSRFKNGVDLYTSDGGFEVKGDSEIETIRLKTGEILTGLLTVATGGSMVVKLFGCLQPWTQFLITTCIHYFEDVELFKPVLSAPTNLEIYLICTNRKKDKFSVTFETLEKIFNNIKIDVSINEMNSLKLSPSKIKQSQIDIIKESALGYKEDRYNAMKSVIDAIENHNFLIIEEIVGKTYDEFIDLIGF